jgi:hypothetical protein
LDSHLGAAPADHLYLPRQHTHRTAVDIERLLFKGHMLVSRVGLPFIDNLGTARGVLIRIRRQPARSEICDGVIPIQRHAGGGFYGGSGVVEPANVELGTPAISATTKQPATNARNFERFVPNALDYLSLI